MATTKNSSTRPTQIKLMSSDAQNELITMGERWAVANQLWRLIAGLFSGSKTTLQLPLNTAGILLFAGFSYDATGKITLWLSVYRAQCI